MQGDTEQALRSAKAELRKAATERRRAAASTTPEAEARVAANFLAAVAVPPEAVVSGFWPMGDEMDIRPLLKHFHDRGHRCALPVTGPRGTALTFRRWTPETEMQQAVFGTREPPASAEMLEPDVLIVPLLAFDRAGHRLGYGAGYYDRTLAGLRARKPIVAVGVGFAAQEVPEVPHHRYDERLDWIVTELGARKIEA